MNLASVNSLQRRLKRLEDQAARHLQDQAPIQFICYWANEEHPHIPGAKTIITDWSTGPALEREDKKEMPATAGNSGEDAGNSAR